MVEREQRHMVQGQRSLQTPGKDGRTNASTVPAQRYYFVATAARKDSGCVVVAAANLNKIRKWRLKGALRPLTSWVPEREKQAIWAGEEGRRM